MNKYVCGFLFWRGSVLLVEKTHPPWQHGLLNGVGGNIEEGEAAEAAMVREFEEETKLAIAAPAWHKFASERAPNYEVHFYSAFILDCDPQPVVPRENDRGEKLCWRDIGHLLHYQTSEKVVGNLHWLLPLALDWRRPVTTCYVGVDIRERPSW